MWKNWNQKLHLGRRYFEKCKGGCKCPLGSGSDQSNTVCARKLWSLGLVVARMHSDVSRLYLNLSMCRANLRFQPRNPHQPRRIYGNGPTTSSFHEGTSWHRYHHKDTVMCNCVVGETPPRLLPSDRPFRSLHPRPWPNPGAHVNQQRARTKNNLLFLPRISFEFRSICATVKKIEIGTPCWTTGCNKPESAALKYTTNGNSAGAILRKRFPAAKKRPTEPCKMKHFEGIKLFGIRFISSR